MLPCGVCEAHNVHCVRTVVLVEVTVVFLPRILPSLEPIFWGSVTTIPPGPVRMNSRVALGAFFLAQRLVPLDRLLRQQRAFPPFLDLRAGGGGVRNHSPLLCMNRRWLSTFPISWLRSTEFLNPLLTCAHERVSVSVCWDGRVLGSWKRSFSADCFAIVLKFASRKRIKR